MTRERRFSSPLSKIRMFPFGKTLPSWGPMSSPWPQLHTILRVGQ
jgi:hypothetical protein